MSILLVWKVINLKEQLKTPTEGKLPQVHSQKVKLPREAGVLQYCHFHSATFRSVSSTHA